MTTTESTTSTNTNAREGAREDEAGAAVGKYRCLLRLDQGGMAEVFLALAAGPAGFNKILVVKRLREALADNAEHLSMFLSEARLAARLNHPNVVQTYEVGEDGDGVFIAMEYLEGQPLSRLRKEIGRQGYDVSHALYARLVSEVLSGLHYAHEVADYDGTPLNIVHRDVSPQNVFVTYDGQVKLVDFGIAKTNSSGTQAGVFKGKFAYTAPEQLGGEAVDRRADIFTAGIVLWELLTGARLLASDNAAKTFSRLLYEPIPRASTLVPDIDPFLDDLVARALEKNLDDRFQTAQEMRDALEAYIEASGAIVRQEGIAKMLSELFRKERARVQQVIKEQLALWALPPSSSRVVVAPRLSMESSVVFMQTGRSPTSTMTAAGQGQVAAVERDQPTLLTHRRIGVALGVLLAMGLGALALSRRERAPSPSGAAPIALTIAAETPSSAPLAKIEPSIAKPDPTPTATHVAEPIATPTPKPTFARPASHAHKSTPTSESTSTTSAATPPAPSVGDPVAPQTSANKEKRKFRTEL